MCIIYHLVDRPACKSSAEQGILKSIACIYRLPLPYASFTSKASLVIEIHCMCV